MFSGKLCTHSYRTNGKIRFKRQNVFYVKLARSGLITCGSVIAILLIVNFLSSYNPVFRSKSVTLREDDPNAFYAQVRTSLFKNDLVSRSPNVVADNEKCDTIHVGLVCAGYTTNLYLHTMLKSLLFYRNNPLHLHIIVNPISEKVLRVLFNTWGLPQVTVSFYNVSQTVDDVKWVPNHHYAGVYALLKLTFPKLVPLHVTKKLIVLDTDIVFNDDIFELWLMFENFNERQVVGIVENQSNFYLNRKLWPAIGRGYNTGVMLYHLEHMRDFEWNTLWANVARRTAMVHGSTRLADQDIVNALIKEKPHIFFQVPCQWNTQLSINTLSHNCYKNNNKVKIVHWNSPLKYEVKNNDSEYFRNMRAVFLELNGNLLRTLLHDCSDSSLKQSTDAPPETDVCHQFNKGRLGTWRTILFFREFSYAPSSEFDVTYAVQLSFERLQMVEELCKSWKGPISVTLYLTDPELQEAERFVRSSDVLRDRANVAYHAVFKEGELYPINFLRNVGLQNVNTNYVFLADIDFLPLKGLYADLKRHLSYSGSTDRKAFVIPAFETQRYKSKVPKNKAQLIDMFYEKKIFTFRYDVWSSGQAPTNYTKWFTAKAPYVVKWEPDFEPYIVVRSDVIEYDNRFMGFGWNKVSHIMELAAQGFSFVVLPDVFIVHKPHAPSYDINKFRTSPEYRMCLQNLKEKFVDDIRKKYGTNLLNKVTEVPAVPL